MPSIKVTCNILILIATLHNTMSVCPYMRSRQARALQDDTQIKDTISTIIDNVGIKYLTNADFKQGTYRITQPGRYILKEDIVFAPNTANTSVYSRENVMTCCKPRPDQLLSNGGMYSDMEYSLGFFAAITVEVDNVEIDLNKHSLEQSKEHALMQRFFSLIELASTPFIPGQGPRNFGDDIVSAKSVYIHDGTIGLSSHHGIHGNGNRDVRIEHVDFVDYEVAAVALNGVEGLKILNCNSWSREDVPVLGIFSTALFIHRYVQAVDELVDTNTTLRVQGVEKTVQNIRKDLEDSIIRVYEDVIRDNNGFIDKDKHPAEYALFHNRHKVIDGNAYGFLTNRLGVAVGGFPFSTAVDQKLHSRNVEITDTTIHRLKAAIDEVVALRNGRTNKAVNDPLGSIFQLRNQHPDNINVPVTISTLDDDTQAEYIGNVVSNAQLMVAKLIINGQIPSDVHLPTQTNQINDDIINWAQAGGDTTKPDRFLSNLLHRLSGNNQGASSGYFCNGDSMFHVNKGVVGFKIDNTDDVMMKNCNAYDMMNLGRAGSKVCGYYFKSHPDATSAGYGGANVRGFSLAGSKRANLYKCNVSNLVSSAGAAIGYDVQTNSKMVHFVDCHQDGLEALGEGGYSPLADLDACGLRFCEATRDCRLKDHCFGEPLASVGVAVKVMNLGINNIVDNAMC